jgi:ABC-type lipoprotein export system ATPase subunit
MRAVRGGQTLPLTIRWKVVAQISPESDTQTTSGSLHEKLKELEAQGLIRSAKKTTQEISGGKRQRQIRLANDY